MTPTNLNETVKVSIDPEQDLRYGGVALFIGALLFVITIGFEQQLGWPPPDGAHGEAIAALIQQLWPYLRWLWAVQMLASLLFGVSALLILRSRHLQGRWIKTAGIWSVVAIGSIIATMAYGLSLGGYPPALLALEDNPDLFATFRGGVRLLYTIGLAVVVLGLHALFIGEGVTKSAVVSRSWLIGAVVGIAVAIVAGMVGLPTAGVVAFLMPALLGLALCRAGWHYAPDSVVAGSGR
jgi:hypothetical protein